MPKSKPKSRPKPKEFNLLSGEKIVEEIKPSPALEKYFFVNMLIPTIIPMLFIVPFLLIVAMIAPIFLLLLVILLAVYIYGLWYLSNASYEMAYYWITNKRIITKKGIIGYRITSIPFERISDIIISRTFLENLCGIASLHIQSLAGQASYTSPHGWGAILMGALGSEAQLFAIPDPEEMQNKILKLVTAKRKKEHLTF
jgi:membrane protein YdbS with pleckstrin-like domain